MKINRTKNRSKGRSVQHSVLNTRCLTLTTEKTALASGSSQLPRTYGFNEPRTSYAESLTNPRWMSSEAEGAVENSPLQPVAGIEPAAHGLRGPGRYRTTGLQQSYHKKKFECEHGGMKTNKHKNRILKMQMRGFDPMEMLNTRC
ncbi:MAG: hypothetical protein UY79_C0020G0004 [Parcubacteria group bacterium GW2011_GWA2_53_21]|nr:MAG: hypothetical protein UY79_C0020G0004 [Parcubacteria group bacterium GW2011_GWA2_53_21]